MIVLIDYLSSAVLIVKGMATSRHNVSTRKILVVQGVVVITKQLIVMMKM